MLRASSVASGTPLGARLDCSHVPLFDGVAKMAEEGLCPGGTRRNLEYAERSSAHGVNVAQGIGGSNSPVVEGIVYDRR